MLIASVGYRTVIKRYEGLNLVLEVIDYQPEVISLQFCHLGFYLVENTLGSSYLLFYVFLGCACVIDWLFVWE